MELITKDKVEKLRDTLIKEKKTRIEEEKNNRDFFKNSLNKSFPEVQKFLVSCIKKEIKHAIDDYCRYMSCFDIDTLYYEDIYIDLSKTYEFRMLTTSSNAETDKILEEIQKENNYKFSVYSSVDKRSVYVKINCEHAQQFCIDNDILSMLRDAGYHQARFTDCGMYIR